jgi:glycosyltransferase involved in cell wall biosynthesis
MNQDSSQIIKPQGVRIAVLVPAYNEERNIRRNIRFIRDNFDEIDQIVVINDGSEDRTADIVREEYGVDLVDLKQNVGKGGALRAGLKATNAEIILLLDADLVGLTREHVAALLAPVLDGRAQTTMGVFTEGRFMTDLAQKVAPQLSGQRAIRRELLEGAHMDDARYGVEVAINRHLEERGVAIHEVELPNVSQIVKEEKYGVVQGFKKRLNMYYEVFKTMLTGQ